MSIAGSIMDLLDGARRRCRNLLLLVVLVFLAGAVHTWTSAWRTLARDAERLAERLSHDLRKLTTTGDAVCDIVVNQTGRIAAGRPAWLVGFDLAAQPGFTDLPATRDGRWTLLRARNPLSGTDGLFLVLGRTDSRRIVSIAADLPARSLSAAIPAAGLRGHNGVVLAALPGSTWTGAEGSWPLPGSDDLRLIVRRPWLPTGTILCLAGALAWLVLGGRPLHRMRQQVHDLRREQELLDRTLAGMIESSCDRHTAGGDRFDELREVGDQFLAGCDRLDPAWREHRQHLDIVRRLVDHLLRLADGVDQVSTHHRRAEEQLNTTLDLLAEAVIITDAELHVRRLNRAAEELTGWRPGNATGQPLTEVLRIDGDDPMLVCQHLGETIAQGCLRQGTDPVAILDRQGQRHSVTYRCAPLAAGTGDSGAVVILFDLTEPVRLQERLREAQRLESIGQLAIGLAHDCNNQLTGITGLAERLHRAPDTPVAQRPQIRRILTAARRAGELTGRLLSFARQRKPQREPTDIHRVIHEAVDLLRQPFEPAGIAVETRLLAHLPGVLGDWTDLINICVNLGINARDAMPHGGQLVFATRNITATVDLGPIIAPGTPCLEISVCDTGTGIAAEVLPHIFEPFFTTKPDGRGTGLGLATTRNLVTAAGGIIRVESTPGTGTTFCIILPSDPAGVGRQTHTTSCPPAVGSGRILVVDDDPGIRELMADILGGQGFVCTTAADGREAVQRFRENDPCYDLVLLDVTMPRMNGIDTFRAIREINPQAQIVLCSGHGEITDAGRLYREGLAGFVIKPFHANRLIRTVMAALTQVGTARHRRERQATPA